jgi:glutamate 5-kinase
MAERYRHLAVIKTGSAVLVDENGVIQASVLEELVRDMVGLTKEEWRILWVVSGAVAHGKAVLEVEQERNYSTAALQAISAIGQGELYQAIATAFREQGVMAAQILLTFSEVTDRRSYLRVQEALRRLLHWGAVPVLNENDSVTAEGVSFGNNDWLAAQLSCLVQADKLVLLTTTPGVLSRDPRRFEDAVTVRRIEDVEGFLGRDDVFPVVEKEGIQGRGGMRAKLRAAELAARRGVAVTIGSLQSGSIRDHLLGRSEATIVTAEEERHNERANFRFWLEHARPPVGYVTVDDGARDALQRRHGASLLVVGIADASGDFIAGDLIEVRDLDGRLIAKGITQFSSREIDMLAHARQHIDPEDLPEYARAHIIHRDEMVVVQQNN